ncbi:MAG: cysteine-rich CWC family protein [Crocinitomicaceae bacterium]
MKKTCEKCNKVFECRADNINLCHCNKSSLTIYQLKVINTKYKQCLCKNCLSEYAEKKAH